MQLIRRVSQWISEVYSLPLMLALFLLALGFFWLFNFSNLPVSNPSLMKLSNGEQLLDLRLFYPAEEAYTALQHYGPAGREMYLRFLAADFIFIPIYSFGFALLLTQTARTVWGGRASWLNVLPFFIGLFDIMENLCILAMLRAFPHRAPVLGTLSGFATLSKYLLTGAALFCLAYAGLALLGNKIGCKRCTGPGL